MKKFMARGAQDNKGPTIAAYFALKILKELKLPLSKRIKLILGVDEETGFRCMKHYFTKLPEVPVSVFVPDSRFPAVYCEKGLCDFSLQGVVLDDRIISIKSGKATNVVPDLAQAVLKFDPSYKTLFNNCLPKNDTKATLEPQGYLLKITFYGKSVHGSTPERGKHALYDLMKVLKALGITNNLVIFFNDYLVDSLDGHKIGIFHLDEKTTSLTCQSGFLILEKQQAFLLLI
ncbi:M20/M25/M40 family metallo-hydrolase [Paulownia witches'-broom phytoplasma]|uniref:M20/M25/M40 family metallo-hydrolase n=1 Tax=Paulownia witches'-broom phytoplasma TaxID=39647 RepID=UPI001CEDF2A4|nr:M20/M25/M40 family metallo-hydrolase [Paulownia witches'-broom phytoplasma]